MLSIIFQFLPFKNPTKNDCNCYIYKIDNSPNRLIFYLDKSRQKKQIPEKNLSKVVKSQNLVEKCCNVQKIYIALRSLQIFSLLCYVRKLLPFLRPKGKSFVWICLDKKLVYKMNCLLVLITLWLVRTDLVFAIMHAMYAPGNGHK